MIVEWYAVILGFGEYTRRCGPVDAKVEIDNEDLNRGFIYFESSVTNRVHDIFIQDDDSLQQLGIQERGERVAQEDSPRTMRD